MIPHVDWADLVSAQQEDLARARDLAISGDDMGAYLLLTHAAQQNIEPLTDALEFNEGQRGRALALNVAAAAAARAIGVGQTRVGVDILHRILGSATPAPSAR